MHDVVTTPAHLREATQQAIRLRDVHKSYKLYSNVAEQALDVLGLMALRFWRRTDFQIFSALNGINLDIARGERVGIIGRNGAGKTTLLKLITGNFAPTGGQVEINGDVQALMSTGVGFHSDFTGAENIRASLLYNGLPSAELEAAFDNIVDFCELGDFLHQPVKTYSLGMRARLQFATATAIKPDILIVDEVLGAGDAYFSVKSTVRMQKLAKSGCTLLLVSHAMNQVLAFCDRAIWLDQGRVRSDGPARQVVGEYEVFMHEMSESKLGVRSRKQDAKPVGDAFRLGRQDSGLAQSGALPATLADGKLAFRWPSEPGIKLDSIDLCCGGKVVDEFREQSAIEFRAQLRCDADAEIACRYQIQIQTLDNRLVTRIRSEPDRFRAKPGLMRDVTLTLDPCLLGAARYYITFVVLVDDGLETGAPQRRYDLVSRFMDFEVVRFLDYREPAVFFHDADWQFGPPAAENFNRMTGT